MMRLTIGTERLAKILPLSPRTLAKAIDRADIPGRKIPGSRVRRVEMNRLRAYLRTEGFPQEIQDAARPALVLLATADPDLRSKAELALDGFDAEVAVASSAFEVGFALMATRHCCAIVVDLVHPLARAQRMYDELDRDVDGTRRKRDCRLLAVGDLSGASDGRWHSHRVRTEDDFTSALRRVLTSRCTVRR
jgi:hypothetical protein